MSRKVPPVTALLYRRLEEEAGRHQVRAIRILGKGADPLGLLLIGNDIPGVEVASALAGLNFNGQFRPTPTWETAEILPDLAWLRRQLGMELTRTRQARLPCALILFTLSGHGADDLTGKTVAELVSCLPAGELLSGFKKNSMALIMPGAAVGKARKRAAEIRTTLRKTSLNDAALNLSMGIAVCHAYECMTADQLLALAETELDRAAGMGNDAICQSEASRSEDSCQVTVEERAQLWLQPGTKPARKADMGA